MCVPVLNVVEFDPTSTPGLCRFVNPSNRGSLAVSMLLLYVLMGVPAGYSSSVLYKSFKGRKWQQCTLLTALLFPSLCFGVFLSLNLMSQRYHSTQVKLVPYLCVPLYAQCVVHTETE